MGQGTSRNHFIKKNKKNHFGTVLFGNTTSLKASVYLNESGTDEYKGDDNLLFKPFLYGLGQHQSTHSLLTIDSSNNEASRRTDSGFLLYEKNSQLWKDLMYIDQTYYKEDPQEAPSTPLKQLTSYDALGDALYFNDIAAMCLSMTDLDLSKRGFGSISSNIGLLPMIRKLDLSYNHLKELPVEIGHLQNLESLSVAHNRITCLPETICHLSKLTEFNISHNQLKKLTPLIRHLTKLQTLILGHNQLHEIDAGAFQGSHCNVALLDLSYNPLTVLPAEITQLPFLRRLRLDGCPLTDSLDHYSVVHNPPSLVEICARIVVQKEHVSQVPKPKDTPPTPLESMLTEQLYDYLCSYQVCSHCHGPYFESFVSRGRWIERNDVWIPLEYRLCSAHWSDESDRMLDMFSTTHCTLPLTHFNTITLLPATIVKSNPLPVATETVLQRPYFYGKRNTEQDMLPSSSTSTATVLSPQEGSFSSTIIKWKHKAKKIIVMKQS